jgi:hypothetical protein
MLIAEQNYNSKAMKLDNELDKWYYYCQMSYSKSWFKKVLIWKFGQIYTSKLLKYIRVLSKSNVFAADAKSAESVDKYFLFSTLVKVSYIFNHFKLNTYEHPLKLFHSEDLPENFYEYFWEYFIRPGKLDIDFWLQASLDMSVSETISLSIKERSEILRAEISDLDIELSAASHPAFIKNVLQFFYNNSEVWMLKEWNERHEQWVIVFGQAYMDAADDTQLLLRQTL